MNLPPRPDRRSRDRSIARVRVDLAERGYDVLIGPGARRQLRDLMPIGAKLAAIVTQEGIPFAVETGLPSEVVMIPDGERAKSLGVVEDVCRTLARAGLHRGDVVVSVGGGVVTDVAGFAASIYHRGIAVVHVATTLLAQIDAAIGGKTGVNLTEGKNLVGTFWQPFAVICDTEALATLPEREWRSGRGEMAKYAFLGVPELDDLDVADQVARCVACKAEVVKADEREDGRRLVLNYGHTLAHGLEAAGFASEDSADHTAALRHGEAVGIGLVFAARLAEALGRIDQSRVRRHEDVIAGYGLPVRLPPDSSAAELLTLMGRDKKSTGGLSFVLDGPTGVELVPGVAPKLVAEVLASLGAGR